MQHKVYILTGAIQTGKTTSLLKWCEGKEHVYGIFTPVIDGKRMFMDIATKKMFAMEASEEEVYVLKVGRFFFKAAAFEKAKTILIGATNRVTQSLESEPLQYIVIDEVGPLELTHKGLFTAVQQVLQNQTSPIILVVREGLVDKVIEFFKINNPTIISKTVLELL